MLRRSLPRFDLGGDRPARAQGVERLHLVVTDDDGLTDGDELFNFATGPLNPDTDGDGVLDGDETTNGTDPNDPTSL